jgi:hypothetical protein
MDRFAGSHSLDDCMGMDCVIHNPSGHHMRDWPQRWRATDVLDRVCEHGQAHPDPDQFMLWLAQGYETLAVHECDGCCAYPSHAQTDHRTAADVESELSMLKTVRDVIKNSGAPAARPTVLDEILRDELERFRHRDK